MNKILLIPLTVLLGIYLGFQSHKTESQNFKTEIPINEEILQLKNIQTPQYLSEQLIDYKAKEHTSKPSDENETIIAYYEEQIAAQYEKSAEVYEDNGTLFVNLDGEEKEIASQSAKYNSVLMMPKLSASKVHVAYTWCNEKSAECSVVVENISTKTKQLLKGAVSYSWHPEHEILIYDGLQKEDGHAILESELFFFNIYARTIVQLTQSSNFVETSPIFSEEGADVYCADEKTGRLLHFNLFPKRRSPFIEQVKMFKTNKPSLTLEEVKKQAKAFKKIPKEEKFTEKGMTYWIELTLKKDMESGIYSTFTQPYIFDKISFTEEQLSIKDKEKLMVNFEKDRTYGLTFNYKAGEDAQRYYLRLKSYHLRPPFMQDFFKVEKLEQMLSQARDYSTYSYNKRGLMENLLSAMVVGMILMSALYTAVMFFRQRKKGRAKKSFIYYSLMQLSMVAFLLTAPNFFRGLFSTEFLPMAFLSLVVAFFATLFTQRFLETKRYLPIIHTLLNLYLVLIIADMIWIFDPILLKYKLYGLFALLFILAAILRIINGFKPAWFYLLGWIGLTVCIISMDYYHQRDFMMFIGVFIEASLLAWGLVFSED